ncbi:MAG: phosphotransferase, partial [Anaerolineae bacterium]
MPDTLRQPPFTPADAIALARKLYGLSVTARQLPGERDRNFHLQDNTGRQFVLKISHAAEQKTVLDMQNRAMAHLARQGDYSLCPRALPAQNGDDIATATAPGGTTHFVRLLTHLPGASLATANPHPPQLLRRLGRFMGHVTRALQSFTHPAAHRRLEWDMQHAGQVIAARRGHIQRPERRAIVGHFLSRFETRVLPDLPRLRRSVIHNDANDYNLLLFPRAAPATDARQFRLIDFGDMVYSHTIFELAVAAAYAILNKPEPLRAAAEVVGGYHRCFPLTPLELEHLFTLVCIRLCTSVVMSASRQAEQPDNRYLSISEKPAWAALKKLAVANPNLAHYTFRQACGLPP